MTSFVSKLIGGKSEEDVEKDERVPNAPWYSYRLGQPSPRVGRRARLYNVLRQNKQRIRHARRQARAIERLTEPEAVRRVREWEAEQGESALGHLIDRGDYTPQDVIDSKGIPLIDIADKLGLLEEQKS
jgi:hypothetical protein